MQGIFRKSGFVSEAEDQGQNQMIRDWLGVREQAIVESSKSGSEMFDNRRPETGWVVGSERLGRKFDQNRVRGSNRMIREQLGQQKTSDRVGICEQVNNRGVIVLE